MGLLKNTIRKLLRRNGYDIVQTTDLGVNPFADMQRFLKGQKQPMIFDVGANEGQSVDEFKSAFPDASICSFEPSPQTHETLKKHCEGIPGARTWNCGIGSSNGTLPFREMEHNVKSSFLLPSVKCSGQIVKTTDVPVITLDSFAKEQGIDFVHVLKSDTQGYDFEVLKGASGLMENNRIALVYFEIIFSDMYKNLPSIPEVLRYLTEKNFTLVTFYRQYFQDELLSWTDALFINCEYERARRKSDPSTR
jgi:FkbM family methyltransferase